MIDRLMDIFFTPIFDFFTDRKSFTILKNKKGKIKIISAEETYPLILLATIILLFIPPVGLHFIPILLLLLYYRLFQKFFIMLIYSLLISAFAIFSMLFFEKLAPKYVEWVSDTIFYYIPGSNPTILGTILLLSLILILLFLPFYIFNKLQLWHMAKLVENGFESVYTCSAENSEEALLYYSAEEKLEK